MEACNKLLVAREKFRERECAGVGYTFGGGGCAPKTREKFRGAGVKACNKLLVWEGARRRRAKKLGRGERECAGMRYIFGGGSVCAEGARKF